MRYLSDEELAKYFDDGSREQRPDGARQGGWSLDDAFANPKAGRTSAAEPEAPPVVKTSAPADQPARVQSRASMLPPLSDDLTWSGRDVQPAAPGGFGKMPILFIGALIACALVVMAMGGGAEPGSSLPQIGR